MVRAKNLYTSNRLQSRAKPQRRFNKKGEDVIGTVTSAAWGYRVGKNLAYGFVDPEMSEIGTNLTVDVLDRQNRDCRAASPYDPKNMILKQALIRHPTHLVGRK